MMIPDEGVLFSYFFFVSHNHDFFLLHASSVVGRLLFQGNNGVGFKAVKVFMKNTTRSVAQVWRFFVKPARLDLDSLLRTRKHLCP
jgi:hypothetical protein